MSTFSGDLSKDGRGVSSCGMHGLSGWNSGAFGAGVAEDGEARSSIRTVWLQTDRGIWAWSIQNERTHRNRFISNIDHSTGIGPARFVSQGRADATQPNLAFDSTGRAHIVWQEDIGGAYR